MWGSREDESSQPDDIVSVCAVYGKCRRMGNSADQLRSHLAAGSGDSYKICVTDIHEDIDPGAFDPSPHILRLTLLESGEVARITT